jgi:hypothetical protein
VPFFIFIISGTILAINKSEELRMKNEELKTKNEE